MNNAALAEPPFSIVEAGGRMREASVYYQRFADDYPLDRDQRGKAVFYRATLGDPIGARQMFAELMEIWPDNEALLTYWFRFEHWFGDPERARELAQIDEDGGSARCLDAVITARSTGTPLSEAELDAACAGGFYDWPEDFYAYFGHTDAAFREMEGGSRSRYETSLGLSNLFRPQMRSVRADPRFMSLAHRLGRVDYWLETDQWPDYCSEEDIPYNCREAALQTKEAAEKTQRAESSSKD